MTESGATSQPPEDAAGATGLVDIRGWLGRGWDATLDNVWVLVLTAFLWVWLFAAISAANLHALTLILLGPATGAVYAIALSAVRTGRADANQLGVAGRYFLHLMLVGILVSIFVAVGLVFLIIPGLLIAALYLFAYLLIVDRGLPFWDAMEESRKMVQRDLPGFLAFVLALLGINLLGLAAMLLGVLVSGAVSACAVAAAYQQLWPAEAAPET